MRASRYHTQRHRISTTTSTGSARARCTLLTAGLFLLLTLWLPSGTFAARQPTGSGLQPTAPLVSGADAIATNFQYDGNLQTREKSFKGDLTIPAGSREAIFTSDVTRAPLDFSDVAPHWWSENPDGSSVTLEIRTSKDGKSWSDWQAADEEDVLSPLDSPTETYASLISVPQTDRTHRYVQSRVTLSAAQSGAGPVFHSLTYSFVNAGVTPNPPKAMALAMGTPSDIPKPLLVPRTEWGSPEGKSSPHWAPKYRRVTHIVIHHTATSNKDTDFAARVRAVWYYHAETRGWGDIGYNYLIDPNGVIYEGRAGGDDVEAGHAYPFNGGTMGIGMIGNFMTVAPSASAQAALIDLISWKASQRGIDPLAVEPIKGYTDCGGTVIYNRPTIAGHRDYKGSACGRAFNTSTCPGDRLYDMLPEIRKAIVAEQPPLRAIFLQHDTPGNMAPSATADVHLVIRNSGSLTWQPSGQGAVTLGYRWLTPDGKPGPGKWNSIQTVLPKTVSFADTVTVTAKLNAPSLSGHYALVWDLQRDGEGWFSDQASRPLRVDVVIGTGIGDSNPPESSVLPLPVYINNPEIAVRWAGHDDAKGSGLASYDVQYRIMPQGSWTDWKRATADTEATFEGQDGYTYGFRSRARDAAGNVEAWREEPDAYVTIDTRPPLLVVDTPANGSYVEPGQLLVRGRTDPGTFVAVNDRRAEEHAGVFTSTLDASGRDFLIHVTAADAAGNVARLEITVQAAQRYTDVPLSHPAFLAIEYLSDQGIVSGYGDDTFRPAAPITRGQYAKTLAIALHWGLITPQEPRFADVDPTSWLYPFVETAAARGVLDGYPDGTFRPSEGLSRAAAVRALVQAARWKLFTPKAGHFLDVNRSNRLFTYVETAYVHGALKPDDKGNFRGDAIASRGDSSLLVFGLMQDLVNTTPIEPSDDQSP